MHKIYFSFLLIFLLYPSYSRAITTTNFIPLSIDLEKAMNMDENYSFAVKTAQSEQNNADSQKIFALTQIGPSVSSAGAMNWYDKSNTFANVNNHGEGNNSSTLSVTASEPLIGLIPGSLKIGQTSASLRASEHELTAAKINARLEGAKAYILVQQALRTLEAKKVASKFADETYKQSQILFDTGSVEKTKIDVLQTKAEAATARLAEISTQKDLQTALIDLGIKIGIQNIELLQVSLEEVSEWEKINPKVPDYQLALTQAFEQRPEINASQENYKASKLKVDQGYFNYLPQVNLFATYSRTTNDSPTTYPDANINQSLYGISLNWSIWDGGVQAAQMSDNVNEKTKAFIEQEKTMQTVTQDVQNALNNLNTAIKSLNDAKEASQSYEESFKLATIQYMTGDYSTIDLIETQNKMTATQVALANVRSELDLSWMELQAALGQSPRITQN